MTLRNSTIGNESFLAAAFNNRWNKFREAMGREDQLVLDEKFRAVDIHRDAIHAMNGNEFE